MVAPPAYRTVTCPDCRREHQVPVVLQGNLWNVCIECLDREAETHARMNQGKIASTRPRLGVCLGNR